MKTIENKAFCPNNFYQAIYLLDLIIIYVNNVNQQWDQSLCNLNELKPQSNFPGNSISDYSFLLPGIQIRVKVLSSLFFYPYCQLFLQFA